MEQLGLGLEGDRDAVDRGERRGDRAGELLGARRRHGMAELLGQIENGFGGHGPPPPGSGLPASMMQRRGVACHWRCVPAPMTCRRAVAPPWCRPMTTANPVLVEVMRGPLVESRHRGAAAVVDAAGTVVRAWGDVDQLVYPRSANKPLQAMALLETGAATRWGAGDVEVA